MYKGIFFKRGKLDAIFKNRLADLLKTHQGAIPESRFGKSFLKIRFYRMKIAGAFAKCYNANRSKECLKISMVNIYVKVKTNDY